MGGRSGTAQNGRHDTHETHTDIVVSIVRWLVTEPTDSDDWERELDGSPRLKEARHDGGSPGRGKQTKARIPTSQNAPAGD